MGLHLSVPEHQLSDRGAREHRHRIWWTAYICDRMWASKLGQPASILDDDIEVDLPSSEGLTGPQARDFGDPDYIIASIRLARLATHIIASIYKRKGQHGAFSQRVQQALRNLRSWVEELPSHLQLDTEESLQAKSKPIIYLHLSFNQVSPVVGSLCLLYFLIRQVCRSCNATHSPPRFPHISRIFTDASKLANANSRNSPRSRRGLHPLRATFLSSAHGILDRRRLRHLRLLRHAVSFLGRYNPSHFEFSEQQRCTKRRGSLRNGGAVPWPAGAERQLRSQGVLPAY